MTTMRAAALVPHYSIVMIRGIVGPLIHDHYGHTWLLPESGAPIPVQLDELVVLIHQNGPDVDFFELEGRQLAQNRGCLAEIWAFLTKFIKKREDQ